LATFASTFGFFAVEPITALEGFAGLLFFFAVLLLDGIALGVYQSVAQALLPVLFSRFTSFTLLKHAITSMGLTWDGCI
jgi:hypothetical protein